jgi:nucleoid-associated protein YgaU
VDAGGVELTHTGSFEIAQPPDYTIPMLVYLGFVHSVLFSGLTQRSYGVHDFDLSPPSRPAVDTDSDYTDTEEDGQEEELAAARPAPSRSARSREGLPSAYRMRHARHYVEQLMGDAPIQTVRQVAIDQIDRIATGETGAVADDLSSLAGSIRQVGMLQPLLVIPGEGGRFQLLSGERRLLAAQAAGLEAVPCLVVQADAARAIELRAQATVRSVPPESPVPEAPAEPEPAAAARPLDAATAAAFDEVSGAFEFVAALAPAASAARSTFQQRILADLASVENRRASALKRAACFLAGTAQLNPEEFEWLPFTEELRRDVAVEARLRGVEIEWLHAPTLRKAMADKPAIATAWTSMLHAVLGIAHAGDRIAISLATPRVRPAILLTVTLQTSVRFTPAFAEQGSASTFAGTSGELMLASARQSAQRQGGRLSVTTAEDSVTLEFVAPQPLAYWH